MSKCLLGRVGWSLRCSVAARSSEQVTIPLSMFWTCLILFLTGNHSKPSPFETYSPSKCQCAFPFMLQDPVDLSDNIGVYSDVVRRIYNIVGPITEVSCCRWF